MQFNGTKSEEPAELFARSTNVSLSSLVHIPDDNDPQPRGCLRWSEAFFKESACDGVPRIADSTKGIWRRLIWSTLFLTAFGVLVSQVTVLVRSYFEFPVSIDIAYNFSKSLAFPAVTFCNLNPVRNSKIPGSRFEVLKDPQPVNTISKGSFSFVSASNKTSNGTDSNGTTFGWMDFDSGGFSYQSGAVYTAFIKSLDAIFTAKFFDERVNENKFAELHPTFEELKEMGHQLDEMLLDCTWKGLSCSASDFVTFQNHKYGNCFTFNSGQNGSGSVVSTSKPGPTHGLRLYVTLQQEEYIGSLSPKAGLHVVIHSQDIAPFPEEEGFDVAPGASTNVGVKLVSVDRLPYPWDNCTDGKNQDSIYDEAYGYHGYSTQACMKSCLAKAVVERCGCTSHEFPLLKERVCAKPAVNASEAQCIEMVYNDYLLDMVPCDCPQACHDSLYETTLSAALWPSMSYEDLFRERMKQLNKNITKKTGTSFENNFARVEVYYKEMNYQHISQLKGYPSSRLLSDIGGQMGLWLGLSVLSAMEFFEFVFLVFYNLIQRKMPHRQKQVARSVVV